MKKMNRTELLRYISETLLTYEKLEVISHILWDYMCDADKITDWFNNTDKAEPLFIAIRKHGCECGNLEYVFDNVNQLGGSIHVIRIEYNDEPCSDYDFKVYEQ